MHQVKEGVACFRSQEAKSLLSNTVTAQGVVLHVAPWLEPVTAACEYGADGSVGGGPT